MTGLVGRRLVGLGLLGSLGGCGFRPLYAPAGSGGSGVTTGQHLELSRIYVPVMAGAVRPIVASGLAAALRRKWDRRGQGL